MDGGLASQGDRDSGHPVANIKVSFFKTQILTRPPTSEEQQREGSYLYIDVIFEMALFLLPGVDPFAPSQRKETRR